MSLVESAATGVQIKALQDLRDLLAQSIVSCGSDRDLAALTSRFTDVLERIEALAAGVPTEEKGTALDELEARRAARKPRATGS